MIRAWLREQLTQKYPDVGFDVLTPPDQAMGDYSVNLAFALARPKPGEGGLAKKDESAGGPMEAAQHIADAMAGSEYFEKIQVAKPGFVNFFLKTEFLQSELERIHKNKAYGISDAGKGKKVIVEYSSPNIAKPMHIGHLRSTVIGDALANIFEAQGYDVIRWNYIGDWGTQFGKLIAAYKKWPPDETFFKHHPIEEMLRLYVKFHEELKVNPELEKEGQEEFRKLERGDQKNLDLWDTFHTLSTHEFDKMYDQLGIHLFDVTKGESEYELRLKPLIEDLLSRGIAVESEGALIIKLEPFGLPPALIRKSDGATLYLTREVASLGHRIAEYKPDKILYVVANQQALHFEQLFAVAKMLSLDSAELVHVKFGMVLGEDGKKLATREGKAVPLQEVMDKMIALAHETVKQKNPELSEEQTKMIAHTVGIGALKYNDLKELRTSDIKFNWKAMLDLTGDSGPYLQYAYARLASIVRKVGEDKRIPDVSLLDHPQERRLMRHLLDLPDVIERSAQTYTTNGIALYLYELASIVSSYYEAVRILDNDSSADKKRRDARLLLLETVMSVLECGLNLLGISVLDQT